MQINVFKTFVNCAVFNFIFGNLVLAQAIVHKIDDFSSVDWTRNVVFSTGSSTKASTDLDASERIEALETAKANAVSNLLKAIHQLNLNSDSNILQAIQNETVSAPYLKSVVQHFTIVDTRSMSDMSVEVDVELPIPGKLTSVLFPKNLKSGELRLKSVPLCPTCAQNWPEGRPVPEGVELIIPTEGFTTDTGASYTGLIVDARGLNLEPAIFPKIINVNNQEVYGPSYVERQKAVDSGIIVYKSNLQEALRDGRVGSEPLIIRGVKTSGKLKADIVVSDNDAVLIHAAAKSHNFLEKCKVIIVIG